METIRDILKEMKGANFQPPMYQVWVNKYADRIEAAHNREVADALDTGAFVAEANKQAVTDCNGWNAAKMREALEEILDCCKDSLGYNIAYVEDQARQALSAPARNCDIYNGTGEAMCRYGFPTKSKPWAEADWLKFVDWIFAEAKGVNDEQ